MITLSAGAFPPDRHVNPAISNKAEMVPSTAGNNRRNEVRLRLSYPIMAVVIANGIMNKPITLQIGRCIMGFPSHKFDAAHLIAATAPMPARIA